jgi:hypothetical protein
MKRLLIIVQLLLITKVLSAQVGINTENPDKSSALDIVAPDKGFLPPRVNLTSIKDITTIKEPATGLMIYEPDGFTETVNGQSVVHEQGIYTFDGTQWEHMRTDNDSDNGGSHGVGMVGVKINVQQSGYLILSGRQSYGLLMQNQGVSINPTYISGIWPPESSQVSDVITSGVGGNDAACLLENPVAGEADLFRMNFNYVLGNNPPTETRYFTINFVSVATGATIYSDEVVVPGNLNTGHVAPFHIFFPSLADSNSIGKGYRIEFGVDTAGSAGLPNNISVQLIDIVRIN